MYGRAGCELLRKLVIFKSGVFTKSDEEPTSQESTAWSEISNGFMSLTGDFEM
jgi:hypothetical protein